MTLKMVADFYFANYETLSIKIHYTGYEKITGYYNHTKESFERVYSDFLNDKVLNVSFQEYYTFKEDATIKAEIPILYLLCEEA